MPHPANKIETGEQFGHWTTIGPSMLKGDGSKTWSWCLCRCKCGKELEIRTSVLRKGKSNGCLQCRMADRMGIGADQSEGIRIAAELRRRPVSVACAACGTAFTVAPSRLGHIQNPQSVCCSRACKASIAKQDPAIRRSRERDRARRRRQSGKVSPETAKRWSALYPKKELAKRIVAVALAVGAITRGVCEQCGNAIAQGHHDDYDKPLVVRWLCALHHTRWHASNGPGANGTGPVSATSPTSFVFARHQETA